MKTYRNVLTIAGSDSSGGAGIQADLKSISALGCYGMTAITAITAQNTQGVEAVEPVSVGMLGLQLRTVLADLKIDAIKTGMLFSENIIVEVARVLQNYPMIPLVADPVMVSTSGHKLLEDKAIDILKTYLLPKATLITPNIPEAEILIQQTIRSLSAMKQAARQLGRQYKAAILLKGGHQDNQDTITDVLYLPEKETPICFSSRYVNTVNKHGTGCTLSAAIAAGLAQKKSLSEAVEAAKHYIDRAIESGADYQQGHGHGPVHHFYAWWR